MYPVESHQIIDNASQVIYSLNGELNRKSSKANKDLLKAPAGDLTLNLREVSSINVSGLGFLLKLQQTYTRAGHSLELVNLPTTVRMFMDLTRTTELFQLNSSQPALRKAA